MAEEKVTESDITLMSNRIRIMAFTCKSKDVMSCEFGNEFGRRVEEYLHDVLNRKDTTKHK